MSVQHIRNVAIIAHVDHGKTTLVDKLLLESGTFKGHQAMGTRVMDSNELEQERGITILAKSTAIEWEGYRLNLVDTPGHADFGGEVERILGMVDGVLLLVDAAEGPMPQTKFVLTKALEKNLRPIVILNKVDRPDARPDQVLDEIFDLFISLNASEEQLDFPILYASGKGGWAAPTLEAPRENLGILFETIIRHVPSPQGDEDAPFQMLATILEYDPYIGRILTGRVYAGRAQLNMPVQVLDIHNQKLEQGRLVKIFMARGLERIEYNTAEAGDIISIAGLANATVSNTIADLAVQTALPAEPIDPPTLSMTFSVNDSPLAGQDGKKLTSRMIGDRLRREMESNVSIHITETDGKDAFEVAGRGELQLGVLIETMRREGFELSISRPRVLFQTIEGQRHEPIEEVQVDVDEEYVGVVIEKLGLRKGELVDMHPIDGNKTRLKMLCPSRGLIGYRGEFLTDTRGTGVMNRLFHGYGSYKGPMGGRRQGVLIANGAGKTTAYSLWGLEERGILFVDPTETVYEGMIIGEHNRDNDLEVNPIRGKKLTNVRASGKDEGIFLTPPKKILLEEALSYIEDDELVEVTPKAIRIRKRFLDPNDRKRHHRSTK